jgi:hypothetical protein
MPPRKPKVSGVKIGKFKGLKIYGELKSPKRRRKARVLIPIFQDTPKQLHVAECLSYTQSVKIILELEDSYNSRGQIKS